MIDKLILFLMVVLFVALWVRARKQAIALECEIAKVRAEREKLRQILGNSNTGQLHGRDGRPMRKKRWIRKWFRRGEANVKEPVMDRDQPNDEGVLGDRVEPGRPTGLINNPGFEKNKRGWESK